jgi:hypothetical protein
MSQFGKLHSALDISVVMTHLAVIVGFHGVDTRIQWMSQQEKPKQKSSRKTRKKSL